MENRKVKEVMDRIGVGRNVARELLILAGGDVELVVSSSVQASGLSQCQTNIIDGRFKKLEEE